MNNIQTAKLDGLDALLAGAMPQDIPEAIAKTVSPWKKAMKLLFPGLVLCFIGLALNRMDLLFFTVGSALSACGSFKLRRENHYFKACFGISSVMVVLGLVKQLLSCLVGTMEFFRVKMINIIIPAEAVAFLCLLAAFYPACDYDATKIITRVEEHQFRTTGKVIVNNGWHDVPPLENPPKQKKKTVEEGESENPLPPLQEGDTRTVAGTRIKEDKTKPPAPHTDASLLAAMETAGKELDDEELVRQMKGSGIGTPATRAAIIERLLKVGYAQRKGKTLNATDKGVMLIDVVPGELSSPELTGRWELALHDITDGEQDPQRFMDGIARMSSFLVDYARNSAAAVTFPAEERRKGKTGGKRSAPVVLQGAVCPICGKGGIRENSMAFGCTERDCNFTIWKDCLQKGGGPALTGKLLQLLLEKKQLQGSTGILMIREGKILFYQNGNEVPSVDRSMIYVKQH